MRVDLHFHSIFSDGVFTPTELIEKAKDNGAVLLALTDHDSINGLPEAKQAAEKMQIQFVTGVELSVSWRNKVIHVVGLNFDVENQSLIELINTIRGMRIKRLKLIAEKLEVIGISGLYEGALALSKHPDTVGRRHMAEYLLNQGIVNSMQQAFSKYLGDGKKGYVKTQWGSLEEVVTTIVKAGGIAVLAHPLRYNLTLFQLREFLNEFVTYGGRGIEVGCSSHDYNEMMTAALLTEQYGLLASVGSDFHGSEYDKRQIGVTPDLPRGCRPVWETFKI